MPDISLLQHEYGTIEKESKAPKVIFTLSVSVFVLVAGSYIGLLFYNNFLVGRLEAIQDNIEQLQSESVAGTLRQLETFGDKAQALAFLRKNHRYPSRILKTLEHLTHPDVFFSSGNFLTADKNATLSGAARNTFVLARQVEILTEFPERVSGFSVKSIGYGDERAINFELTLNFP